jgi:hypothetical protein
LIVNKFSFYREFRLFDRRDKRTFDGRIPSSPHSHSNFIRLWFTNFEPLISRSGRITAPSIRALKRIAHTRVALAARWINLLTWQVRFNYPLAQANPRCIYWLIRKLLAVVQIILILKWMLIFEERSIFLPVKLIDDQFRLVTEHILLYDELL